MKVPRGCSRCEGGYGIESGKRFWPEFSTLFYFALEYYGDLGIVFLLFFNRFFDIYFQLYSTEGGWVGAQLTLENQLYSDNVQDNS